MRQLIHCFFLAMLLVSSAFGQTAASSAGARPNEPQLGTGDVIRITVYQNPDLTVDSARISESGQINFPLIGAVNIGGLTVSAAEQKIAKALRDGGFVLRPQVTIQVSTIRSAVVSVLGNVARPGRYPIEIVGTKVSEMIAQAGGVTPTGGDIVSLSGTRGGKTIKLEIDLPVILQAGTSALDVPLENGDILFVDRAPMAYIYGEVQKPGQFRIERAMTVRQALAQAGGLTAKGTERGIKVHRKDATGNVVITEPRMNDPVQRDDIYYIKESLF